MEQTAKFEVETTIGTAQGFSYVTPFDAVEQLALVYGDISGGKNIPVRLHRENVLEDVFGNRGTLDAVFDIFKREGKGVLVYLQEGTAGVPASQLSGEKIGQRRGAGADLAGCRAGRADPARSQCAFDPAHLLKQPALCGPFGLRDRDCGDDEAGGVAQRI